jgi:hypothetical protein
VALARRGAEPLAFLDQYPEDEVRLAGYAAAARTSEGFAGMLRAWLDSRRAAA